MFGSKCYFFVFLLVMDWLTVPGDFSTTTEILSSPAPQEVPVLCYHQVRDWKETDSRNARSYIMPMEKFKRQLRMLQESGYHFILPGDLLAFIDGSAKLPPRPLILTFDDGSISEFFVAVPELNRYNIKAVFFIMTVVLNRTGYMSSSQVKTLADQGHVIGCHTWDHHDVRSYGKPDWKLQLTGPKDQLEKITGRPVKYFAYPYGTWNKAAIDELRKNNFTGAFQLAGRLDNQNPQYTIRRIIVDAYWNEQRFLTTIKNTFQ
jgi:peptidoglycan/xylan/chitin deacetylase (PgdA/CDA1 family)